MEYTAEQKQMSAEFHEQLARRLEAHDRVVNAQPRLQQDRVSRESMARIHALMDAHAHRFCATFSPEQREEAEAQVEAMFDTPEAQASDTTAPEASAETPPAPAVVVPGKKI